MAKKQSNNRTSSSDITNQWFELYGNDYREEGCHVSNDPPSANENENERTLATLKTCNITQLMCTIPSNSSYGGANNNSTLSDNIEAIEVLYEYELSYNSAVDLEGSLLPYLEESILENLASQTGISQCQRQQRAQERRRYHNSRTLNDNTTKSKLQSRIVGVNRQPMDGPNPKYTECTAASSSSNFSANIVSKCVPMLGGVTVFVQLTKEEIESKLKLPTSDRQTIKDTISQYIQNAMDNDMFVVPTSIERVRFIGNSTIPTEPYIDSSYNTSKSSSRRTVALVCVIVLIALLLVIFCCTRRRRARRSRLVQNSREIRDIGVSAHQNEDQESKANGATVNGQQCLASMDSLALRGKADNGSLIKNTESDNEFSCDTSRTSTIDGEFHSLSKYDTDENVTQIPTGGNDEQSVEPEGQDENEIMDDEYDVESIVAAMSDELDLLDQLALYGRPPPYPTPSSHPSPREDELQTIPPSRSLSPTTISAASQSTMYTTTGYRKIVGSPTTCSQSTMRAGNLGYVSRNSRSALKYTHANISSAPDSFDAEILGGVTSDGSSEDYQHDDDDGNVPKHFSNPPRTFADVLDGHGSYMDDDEEEDYSYRSDHETTVQQRLQMS